MIIATLDTSNGIDFSVSKDGEILSAVYINAPRGSLVKVPQIVESALQENNISLSDINYWLVGTGPGSFTGIRIGIAYAKGITVANSSKYCGVTTSVALREQALKKQEKAQSVGVMYDGRRQEILFDTFNFVDGAWGQAESQVLTTATKDQELDKLDVLITLNETLTPLLTENQLNKTIFADRVDSAALAKDINFSVVDEMSLKEQAASCEPVYIRPAVFVQPKAVREVK